MGSHMKKSIFDEQTSKALKSWHMAVKKKNKGGRGGRSATRTLGDASPTSSMGSPFNLTSAALHRFKTTGHSTRQFEYDDHEASDLETDSSSRLGPTSSLIVRGAYDDDTDNDTSTSHNGEDTRNEDDFSFAKPAASK